MKVEYDFTDSIANSCKKAKREKITIQLNAEIIEYFKEEADRTGIPYQNIINFYLLDCVRQERKLMFS